jgi:signal transduction histidine kinase
MFSSLRTRVLFWSTALLGVVIVIFGGTVCLLAWRARLAEVDAMLAARARALAGALETAPDGTFDLVLPPEAAPGAPAGLPALYFVLWTPAGQPIDWSDPALDVPAPDEPGARTRLGRRELTVTAPAGALVLVGRDMADIRAEIWALAGRLGLVGLGALVVAFVGGWLLVGRALAPIDRISRTARAMSAGDLAARVPLENVETDLEQLARVLNDAFDRLHAAVERQKRFTADASHELRTPLTSILGYLELLEEEVRDRAVDSEMKMIGATKRNVVRLGELIDDLLALTRSEGRNINLVPLDLALLTRDIVTDLRVASSQQGVEIRLRVPGTPVPVRADSSQIARVVTNLVSNAVKFSHGASEVVVTVTADDREAVLAVEDHGIGIPAAEMDQLGSRFYRASNAVGMGITGTGLGLRIVQAIVENHHGSMDMRSDQGLGTTVWVRLPLDFGAGAQLLLDEPGEDGARTGPAGSAETIGPVG